ncbi:MAG: serine--tRNA ligase, partial [Actinobacteria bacterium]|nr:serine--tRNA ligase [Actinomycetota bacterium]
MIDPNILRTDPDRIRESQRRRGESVEVVDLLIEADLAKRAAMQEFDELRNQQKVLGKQIGPLQGALKKATDEAAKAQAQAEVDALMAQASTLADD